MNDINVLKNRKKATKEEQEHIFLLKNLAYTCWYTLKMVYFEIYKSRFIKGKAKHQAGTELKFIQNRINLMQKQAGISRDQFEELNDSVIENTTLMMSVMAICSRVPAGQVDFFDNALTRVAEIANSREKRGVKDEEQLDQDINKLTKKI